MKRALLVIYIQHKGKDGSILEEGSEGWQIYNTILPLPNEKVFSKNYNSAFKETGLKEYLIEKQISNLIITGLQTEYCIDTSCKVAFEYGFNIVIPEMTNTTFDNKLFSAKEIYEHYNELIFKDRFASVEPLSKVLSSI